MADGQVPAELAENGAGDQQAWAAHRDAPDIQRGAGQDVKVLRVHHEVCGTLASDSLVLEWYLHIAWVLWICLCLDSRLKANTDLCNFWL